MTDAADPSPPRVYVHRDPAPAGLRAWSRITIDVDVAHDGDPEVIAEHLADGLEALIECEPGIDIMDGPNPVAYLVAPGDEVSATLPPLPSTERERRR